MAHLKKKPRLFWIIVVALFLIIIKILHLHLYSNSNVEIRIENVEHSKLSDEIVRETGRSRSEPASTEPENNDSFETVDFDYYDNAQNECPATNEVEEKIYSDINMLDIYEHLVFNDSRQFGFWQQFWEIKIDNSRFTDNNKLTVFLLPHSHNDPGWLRTFEQYYNKPVKKILDLIIENLDKDPTMKFIWAEMSFFSLWWDEISNEKRLLVKRIVERKQLEFVTGGWVMPDEANSHYYSILIQLLEGNLWLKQHLNYIPSNGWSIDPFGLSPTMAYILKRSGFKNMLIQRTHYLVKQYLGNRQELEFLWRQSWDNSGSTDMMTHMMPFSSYATGDTCGPDQHLCRTYDFKEKSSNHYSVIPTTTKNIKSRSTTLVEQYKKKGMLFKTNNILVPLGNDFAWANETEWANMTINYRNISDHVNQRQDLYTQMRYGTLDDYFAAIHSDFTAKKIKVPTLSGDFFTYADRGEHYWSGYYTSRPFHKALDRKLISNLRSAHILYTFLNAELNKISGDLTQFSFMKTLFGNLRCARRTLSLFQHHDGVTGTSKDLVMRDYAKKLNYAISNCSYVMEKCIQILTRVKEDNIVTILQNQKSDFFDTEAFQLGFQSVLEKVPIYSLPTLRTISLTFSNPRAIITVYNSLSQMRTTLVSLKIEIPDDDEITTVQVTNMKGQVLDSELFPYFEKNQTFSKNIYQLNFIAKQDAIAISNFIISKRSLTESERSDEKPKVFLIGAENSEKTLKHHKFDVFLGNNSAINISNGFLDLNFDSNGFISSSRLNGKIHNLKIRMFTYGTKSKGGGGGSSGLYIFFPDGPAKLLEIAEEPLITIVKGRLQSYVEVSLPIIQHRITIYNHPEIEGNVIDIRNRIDLSNKKDFELMMRFESDVNSGNISYTDLNAFQMIERKRFKTLPLQGHYYPMPSAAYIEDSHLRLTVLGGQPVGTASLESGQIDVVMDRTLNKDDEKGVGQGTGRSIENVNTFRLLIETSECQEEGFGKRFPMLSLSANLGKNELLHPLHIFRGFPSESTNASLSEDLVNVVADYRPSRHVPCDVEFVDSIPLANFPDSLDDTNYAPLPEAAVLLHRVGFDSRFKHNSRLLQCYSSKGTLGELSLNDLFYNLLKKNVTQMTLSFLHELKILQFNETFSLDPMEIYAFYTQF